MKILKGVFFVFFILISIISLAEAATVHLTQTQVTSPIVLNTANTIYILDNNLTCTGSCFVVTANDVTLDLNSKTATFGTDAGQFRYGVAIPPGYTPNPNVFDPLDIPSTHFRSADRTIIKNGSLIQGAAGIQNIIILAHEAAYLSEVGNITGYFQGTDSQGIISVEGGNINVHDNTIQANLTLITNRHNAKAAISVVKARGYVYVRNNLVYGNGQFGINVTSRKAFGTAVTDAEVSGNTMRINGITTNPYQLIVHGFSKKYQNVTARIFNNRIESPGNVSNRGFLIEGIDGSADGIDGAKIYNNYFDTKEHGNVEYGENGWTHGFRMRDPDYVIPESKFFNNEFYNNTFKTTAFYNSSTDNGDGISIRITLRNQVPVGENPNIFHDNTIIAQTLDSRRVATAIGLEGHYSTAGTIFRNNTIISDTNILGVTWQGGSGVLFNNNTIQKGTNPVHFKPVSYNNAGDSIDNVFLDNTFGPGVDFSQVQQNWMGDCCSPNNQRGDRSFWIKWTLNIHVQDIASQPVSGANVIIKDKSNNQVFNGVTDAAGNVVSILPEFNWRQAPTYPTPPAIKTTYNPYSITVSKGPDLAQLEVTMDAPKQITINLTTGSSNNAPILNSIGNKTIGEGQALTFSIFATDADLQALTLTAGNLPPGAYFTDSGDSTGEFTWTPDYSQAGTYPVTFITSDGSLTDQETITITVNNVNRAPVLSAIGDKTINEGQLLSLNLTATDPEGDTLTYSASSMPTGATFSSQTFIWTPANDQAGTYMVLFTVSDGQLTDSEAMTINVNDVGSDNSPPAAVGDLSANVLFLTNVELSWTAPGDDGASGAAASYDIRYSTNEITPLTWATATQIANEPIPQIAGTGQSAIVSGLGSGKGYYFAIKTIDEAGNTSDLSNSAFAFTPMAKQVNRPPVFDPIGDQSVNKGIALTFVVSATDPNGDSLTYSASNLPNGATFSNQTFNWTPSLDQAGSYQITFTVSDGRLSDNKTITITVNNVNRPPALEAIGDKNINEGKTLSFSLSGSDPDNDSLKYSASNLPRGATFQDQTFSWTPDYDQAGSYQVSFSLSDGSVSDSKTITITVNNVNRAPILSSIGNRGVNEGSSLSFNVVASDPDGDQLTYTTSQLPPNSSFNRNVFSWTPNYSQAGTYPVIFTVSDGNLSAQESVVITVNNIDRAPVLDPIGDQTLKIGELFSLNVSATDMDEDTLTYSVKNLPEGATFKDQTFAWTPNVSQAGEHKVTFHVSDGILSDEETITLTVEPNNKPPVLNAIGNKTVKEGGNLSFKVTAVDSPGDVLTYSASNLPVGASFSNQIFSWVPLYNQAGSYAVTFTVSDGQLSDSEQVSIVVSNANRNPVLGPIGNQEIKAGKTLSFAVKATDPDNDILTYSAFDLPKGATFKDQKFTWTPKKNQVGVYEVRFIVSDGSLSAEETITIKVTHVNEAPILKPIGDKTINVGELLDFAVMATDPDGDKLTYTALDLPSGTRFFKDPSVDAYRFKWTPITAQAGRYKVIFKVTDGSLSAEETITIIVKSVNRPPVLSSIGNKTIFEGQSLNFMVFASDPDNDKLTYSVSRLPRGAKFIDQVFSWKPGYRQAGQYHVTFKVSDGKLTDEERITITVKNVRPPILSGFINGRR